MEIRWYHRIAASLLWGVCRIMSYSPRWFRFYLFAPFVMFVLRLVRYRRAVIIDNLRNSFPEKSEAQRVKIMHDFYRTLAEVVVDTICLVGATPRRDGDVIEWEDAAGHIARNKGRDWVAMAAHFGCWEYYPLWTWTDRECKFLSVYHPLKNRVFELFYRRLRKFSPSIETVPMADTLRRYLRTRSSEHTTVLGLISDQSPVLRADTMWYDFLNQKTAFVEGGERLAAKFGIPVYFVDAVRTAPGRYRAKFIELYDGRESVEQGEITRRYAHALEQMIRRNPELWMWSHKRWKHTPEKQRNRFGTSTLDEK